MYIHIIIIKKIFLSKIWKLAWNNWKNVILCMFWIKMTKNRYPQGVQERACVTFAKHTTPPPNTQPPTLCSLLHRFTPSRFPSPSSCLACPHPSVMLVSLRHCSMLYYATIQHLYYIYNIYVILHTHSNIIYLYYIYISILLVYLSIHYYIPILFYNQYSILHYHSISIYSFYCLDLCIYIYILFIYV